MAVSAWLVFLIVRRHTDWRPAAWIGAALFLGADRHPPLPGRVPARVHPARRAAHGAAGPAAARARGGARGRGRRALLPAGGAARGRRAVPLRAAPGARPAADRLRAAGGRARRRRGADPGGARRRRAARVHGGGGARCTRSSARTGALHFFVVSPLEYLRQNRSGFDLRAPGSILFLAALALLLARPGNARRLRGRGVGDAGRVAALLRGRAGGAVPALPAAPLHVSADPVLRDRRRGAAAADVGRARARRRARWWSAAAAHRCDRAASRSPSSRSGRARALAALETPALLAVAVAAWRRRGGRRRAPQRRARRRAGRVAARGGDPRRLGPARARLALPDPAGRAATWRAAEGRDDRRRSGRPQVPAGDREARRRHLDPARARLRGRLLPARPRSGCSPTCARSTGRRARRSAALRDRYGATHLWIRRGADGERAALAADGRRPYGPFVRGLLAPGDARLTRPAGACRTFRRGDDEVYDIACVQRAGDS